MKIAKTPRNSKFSIFYFFFSTEKTKKNVCRYHLQTPHSPLVNNYIYPSCTSALLVSFSLDITNMNKKCLSFEKHLKSWSPLTYTRTPFWKKGRGWGMC